MTVLAMANPEKGSNELPRATTNPEELAHRKGSGWLWLRHRLFRQCAADHYLRDMALPVRRSQAQSPRPVSGFSAHHHVETAPGLSVARRDCRISNLLIPEDLLSYAGMMPRRRLGSIRDLSGCIERNTDWWGDNQIHEAS